MPSFISNLLKLMSGTMIAQVVAIILIPVVTRLYPPEFFGVNQLFLSIAAVILVISTLSYSFAIMITEKDEDSMTIFVFCVGCLLSISTVSGVIFVGFADWFGNVFNTPLIADYFVWLPVYIAFSSLTVILHEWLSRKVRYGAVAGGIVMNSVSTRVIQIGGGLIHASPLGLILGSVIGAGLGNLLMLRGLKEDVTLLKSVTGERMRELAARYKHFSLYASLGSLANSVSWELPAFMLAYFFNPTVVGYYALAIMAVRLPMAMVGKSITQVFFQKASEERIHTGDVKTVVREIHTRLISVGIFPFVVFVILAQDLFAFVFGANWLTAGTYAMILSPWIFAVFIISPLSTLFGVLDRQRAFFFFEILTLCAWTLLFSIGGTFGDPIIVLALFSIGGTFIWGAKSAYLIREAEAGYRGSVLSLTRHLLLSIAVSLPLLIGKYAGLPLLLLFGIAGATAVAYYLLIFFTDTLIRREVLKMIRGSISPRYVERMERLGLLR